MTVTVALATYNGATYLEGQIKSILQGSRQPDEWVVVDDASSDGSLDQVRALLTEAGTQGATFITNKKNIGASASFAHAVSASTGDVILFCDQDDIWSTDKVKLITEAFAEDDDLLLAYHDGPIIDADGRPDGRTIWSTRKHARLARGNDRDPMDVAANPDIKGCTMAIKGSFARVLFAQTPSSFHSYWGHDHWAALLAWGSGRVKAMPEQLIQHRLHGRNTSAGTRFNAFSPAHWRQRMRAARSQAPDHYVKRYTMALEIAKASPHFDPRLLSALEKHLEFAQRRMILRNAGPAGRWRAALSLWQDGFYREHANGAWTLLRDLVS